MDHNGDPLPNPFAMFMETKTNIQVHLKKLQDAFDAYCAVNPQAEYRDHVSELGPFLYEMLSLRAPPKAGLAPPHVFFVSTTIPWLLWVLIQKVTQAHTFSASKRGKPA